MGRGENWPVVVFFLIVILCGSAVTGISNTYRYLFDPKYQAGAPWQMWALVVFAVVYLASVGFFAWAFTDDSDPKDKPKPGAPLAVVGYGVGVPVVLLGLGLLIPDLSRTTGAVLAGAGVAVLLLFLIPVRILRRRAA